MLRKRRNVSQEESSSSENHHSDDGSLTKTQTAKPQLSCNTRNHSDGKSGETSWFVTKWAILRLLGATYLVAFLGALFQNKGLLGRDGLQPAQTHFQSLTKEFASPWEGFLRHPSLFWWWIPMNDDSLEAFNLAGSLLSVLVLSGMDSAATMAVLWMVYFSVVTSAQGTSFYSYGWESQLLETGFLAIFLCNDSILPTWQRNAKGPPSTIVLYLFRWLAFRISMGAGLIKIRGDSCWTQKTCLHYHFETQPIPSPTSFIFHFLPKWALTHAVDLDLFVQVYTSWMVLLPTSIPRFENGTISKLCLGVVRMGGFIQSAFMINIILTGNFAFLNHLTIIPSLACLDDHCWPSWLRRLVQPRDTNKISAVASSLSILRLVVNLWLAWTVLTLSRPVVDNLLQIGGRRQHMNASFDSFRLVNTYGAFGSVGQKRYEPILSISYDGGAHWTELEFPCKPGRVTRRPCFCAPYHYRLDWNIWFLGFKPHQRMLQGRETWLYSLLEKLLQPPPPSSSRSSSSEEDRPWLALLDKHSATEYRNKLHQNGTVPQLAKVDMYHYRMAAPLWEILADYFLGAKNGEEPVVFWWNRTFEEPLIPPVRLQEDGRLGYA